MAHTYDNQRIYFDKLLKSYMDYVRLYKFFNHGSINGLTKFPDFYWLHHYIYRHKNIKSQNDRAAV